MGFVGYIRRLQAPSLFPPTCRFKDAIILALPDLIWPRAPVADRCFLDCLSPDAGRMNFILPKSRTVMMYLLWPLGPGCRLGRSSSEMDLFTNWTSVLAWNRETVFVAHNFRCFH